MGAVFIEQRLRVAVKQHGHIRVLANAVHAIPPAVKGPAWPLQAHDRVVVVDAYDQVVAPFARFPQKAGVAGMKKIPTAVTDPDSTRTG